METRPHPVVKPSRSRIHNQRLVQYFRSLCAMNARRQRLVEKPPPLCSQPNSYLLRRHPGLDAGESIAPIENLCRERIGTRRAYFLSDGKGDTRWESEK